MKAAVCHEFGKPMVVEDVELDPPRRREVRVRIAAVSTCYCDLHIVRGELGGQVPLVAGHEAAGIVEEVGQDVTTARPGDSVVVSSMRSCGRCPYCVSGASHMCAAETAAPDQQSRLRSRQGTVINRGAKTGAFAEQVVLDESQVVAVPKEMPADRAALLGCTVITGIGAVVNTAVVEPGSSVVVIGAGAIGLNVIQGAVLTAAHPIIAVDFVDSRLALARSFGATHTINAGEAGGVGDTVAELTKGGADYVFATVGNAEAIATGFELLDRQGTEVIVGFASGDVAVPFAVNALVFGEKKVMGSTMGSVRFKVAVPWLVDLYLRGALKLDELISARYSLAEINEAAEAVATGSALRNIVLL